MPSKNDALPTGGPVEPSEDYKAETWALRVRQLEAEVAKQTARANAATKIANLTAGDLASEREAHATTKDQYRQQIRLSQDLERTANGFQQRIHDLTTQADARAKAADDVIEQRMHQIIDLRRDLMSKTERVEELNKDLAAAWDANHALEQEVKALRAKAAERDITFQHNTELASALAEANERIEALLRAADADKQRIEGYEKELRDDGEIEDGLRERIAFLEGEVKSETDQRLTALNEMVEWKQKYERAYNERAACAALLSDLRHDTHDHEDLKRTIRVVYAVVKVALNDLTATDGDALDDDANPDAAAQGLHDALALLDASGAFAHRSDR